MQNFVKITCIFDFLKIDRLKIKIDHLKQAKTYGPFLHFKTLPNEFPIAEKSVVQQNQKILKRQVEMWSFIQQYRRK